jgi:hypothetical protein
MRTTQGAEQRNQGCQDSDCCPGVRDQRDGEIAAREAFRHDSGAHNGCREKQ